MTEVTVKEYGRKPYISPGKGQDGGYINAMRRETQKSEFDNPRVAGMKDNPRRGSIDQNDTRKIITTPLGLISEYVSDAVMWGITFDNTGGLYVSKTNGDIYYRPAGSATFEFLVNLPNECYKMACVPSGDIYAPAYNSGIYIRSGGVGGFVLFEAGGWGYAVDADPNGDVYAMKNDNKLYVRISGAPSFTLVEGITPRGYNDIACAPNGDLYGCRYGEGGTVEGVYVRTGRTGDFVQLNDINDGWSLDVAPNGDVYFSPYRATEYIYKRAGGVGDFLPWFQPNRPVQDFSVSPAGYLFISSSYYSDHQIYQINTDTGIQPPVNTIVQRHSTPLTSEQPLRKNLKPYANRTYEEMQQYARPIDYTGMEKQPETVEAKPLLVDHIPEVSWFVRNGSPVVIDIPTNEKDPVSRVEIYARVDGFASVAPNGTSVIYNPGASGAALLIVHTKSGQQCTVNLLAK